MQIIIKCECGNEDFSVNEQVRMIICNECKKVYKVTIERIKADFDRTISVEMPNIKGCIL